MNNNLIKKLEIENFIWYIYIILILLSIYGNVFEKNYILTKNNYYKNIYRNITIFVFVIALIIYIYYFYESYNTINNLNHCTEKKKNLNELSFFATTLILISGIIFVYIAIVDEDLDVELALT